MKQRLFRYSCAKLTGTPTHSCSRASHSTLKINMCTNNIRISRFFSHYSSRRILQPYEFSLHASDFVCYQHFSNCSWSTQIIRKCYCKLTILEIRRGTITSKLLPEIRSSSRKTLRMSSRCTPSQYGPWVNAPTTLSLSHSHLVRVLRYQPEPVSSWHSSSNLDCGVWSDPQQWAFIWSCRNTVYGFTTTRWYSKITRALL